jgi:hypothetical protein
MPKVCPLVDTTRPKVDQVAPPRTAGCGLDFPATPFLGTVLRALRNLMYGWENSPLPSLRATMSQNILWSTTKVNEAAPPTGAHLLNFWREKNLFFFVLTEPSNPP